MYLCSDGWYFIVGLYLKQSRSLDLDGVWHTQVNRGDKQTSPHWPSVCLFHPHTLRTRLNFFSSFWNRVNTSDNTSHTISTVMSSLLQTSREPVSHLWDGALPVMAMPYLPLSTQAEMSEESRRRPCSPDRGGEMEIITNVSCGKGRKLIHTKCWTLGVSLALSPCVALSLSLIRCRRQMNASRRN